MPARKFVSPFPPAPTVLAPFRRGERIEYTFAAGKVVRGKVVRLEREPRWLGWLVADLTDEDGTSRGCVWGGQCRSIDNRFAKAA